jgi:hypothetical protein
MRLLSRPHGLKFINKTIFPPGPNFFRESTHNNLPSCNKKEKRLLYIHI